MLTFRAMLLTAVLLPSIAGLYAQEERVLTEGDLPPAVLGAFRGSYPNAVIQAVSQEIQDGIAYYEITSLEDSVRRDILYTVQGGLVEVEEAIGAGALPEQAARAVADRYPDAVMTHAEMITRGAVTTYEVALRSGKRRIEVAVTADGQITATEEDELDDDD